MTDATQKFIEKAIEGGWRQNERPKFSSIEQEDTGSFVLLTFHNYGRVELLPIEVYILDPLAWQAVGKVEGWWDGIDGENADADPDTYWLKQWHGLIDALAEGKTIESYLASILKDTK